MTDAIDTRDLDAMIRRLETMPTVLGAEMSAAARMGGEELRDFVAEYPAATGANSPPGLNGYSWYQRGFGTRTGTGLTYPTSENLGKSWIVRLETAPGRWSGLLTTGVSYAHWVQDKAQQAGFHAARGWRTVQDAVTEREVKITRIVQRGVDRALATLSRM